jgi:hypothetical protein
LKVNAASQKRQVKKSHLRILKLRRKLVINKRKLTLIKRNSNLIELRCFLQVLGTLMSANSNIL